MTDALSTDQPFVWRQLHWQRPLEPDLAVGVLRQWAADQRSPQIVLETRASSAGIQYLLGCAAVAAASTSALFGGLATLTPVPDGSRVRAPIGGAVRLKASTRHRPLRTDDLAAAARAVLSAMATVRPDELVVLQIVLGPRRIPLAVLNQSPSSIVAPWWQIAWRGNGGQIDGEKRSALRSKVSDHGFACTIRLGVSANTAGRRKALLLGLLAGLRTSEAAGIKLSFVAERPPRLDAATPPWRWPLRLNVHEVAALTGWPFGSDDLPGQPAVHPKRLPPAPGTTTATATGRVIANAIAPGIDSALTLSVGNALHHLHVIGPTGTGKSTLLLNLISRDIAEGRAVVVIEPKGDLVSDVLARIPDSRRDDVVILDPSDKSPVGLNPLSTHGRRPELIADGVLAIFKQLYGSAVGPRSQDILYAALLTLAQRPDASLVMLPLLLTNPGFRRSLTAGIRDPLTLEPFWASFDAWSDAERVTAVAPVMNKLRPLLRPGLRGVLGQRQPRFRMAQVFTEKKILLVPLQRGVIGPEAAGLLGSLVVADLWQTVLARSDVAPSKRHPVMVYVDEVQDYLHLPTDLGEALAQARGYGVAFTLAHQFLDQLPREMRAAVLANARSRVCFQLPHDDAVALAKGRPELIPDDFTALGQYEVYASLYAGGTVNPYASGRTRSPRKGTADVADLRRRSRSRHGQPLGEASFATLLDQAGNGAGPTGRRRRTA